LPYPQNGKCAQNQNGISIKMIEQHFKNLQLSQKADLIAGERMFALELAPVAKWN
jgi:hypothetical protein